MERVADITATLVANLAALHTAQPPGTRLAIPVEHRKLTRYDRKGFGHLPHVIDALATEGWLLKHPAHIKLRRTGVEATGWLLASLQGISKAAMEVGRAEGEEVLLLTARMGRGARGEKLPAKLIDYSDTPQTMALRAEMNEINGYLARQRIELQGGLQPPQRLTRRFLLRSPTDAHEFNLHGRLYGAFWESLPKAQRGGLRINGEPIADLDFVSMFPRLAYAMVGAEQPSGDLYAIPGLENHRTGVKAGFAALLSASGTMSRLPYDVKKDLPAQWTATRFRDTIAQMHPRIVPLFGHDTAMALAFMESRILLRLLRKLASYEVAALPMHDGIMVPASKAEAAIAAMEEASGEEIGAIIPVVRKA